MDYEMELITPPWRFSVALKLVPNVADELPRYEGEDVACVALGPAPNVVLWSCVIGCPNVADELPRYEGEDVACVALGPAPNVVLMILCYGLSQRGRRAATLRRVLAPCKGNKMEQIRPMLQADR